MRHALELSITVAPRFAASGASAFDVSPPALNSAMSTPSNASGVASSTSISRSPTVDPAARGPLRGEQPQLGHRERLLEQDLGHRPADGAGGADDGDDQGIGVRFGHGPTFC